MSRSGCVRSSTVLKKGATDVQRNICIERENRVF